MTPKLRDLAPDVAITGTHAITSNAETGEIIAEHSIDTGRRYQPNLIKNTHPTQTQTPQS